MSEVHTPEPSFGDLLRAWREHRRLTQLDLSIAADVSTKHLSFLENDRARPSREMALQLAEHLRLPLRERNVLLNAAGFAPVYPQRPLDAPEMQQVRSAIDQVLQGHEPYPAIVVDRCWNILDMNAAAALFVEDVAPEALAPRPNAYRIGLHPRGLAPRVVNFTEFANHLLARLRHDAAASGDPQVAALLEEVGSYATTRGLPRAGVDRRAVVVPIRLRHPTGQLSLFTTVATFGTPVDVTVDELALETFFPADRETGRRLRELAEYTNGG